MLSLQHTKQDGGRTVLTHNRLDFVRETWSQVPYNWLNGLIYSYVYVSVVLTSEISDITMSISTRRTEDFGYLVIVLMLISRLSLLRHKIRYAYVYAYVVVRTRLKRGAIF